MSANYFTIIKADHGPQLTFASLLLTRYMSSLACCVLHGIAKWHDVTCAAGHTSHEVSWAATQMLESPYTKA